MTRFLFFNRFFILGKPLKQWWAMIINTVEGEE